MEHEVARTREPHGRQELERGQPGDLVKHTHEMEPTHSGGAGQILQRHLVRQSHPHGFE